MLTLTYIMGDFDQAVPMARLTLKGGREMYLANSFDQLTAAMEAGDPFLAHQVVGMRPVEIIVNPPHVALIEAVA